MAVSGGDIYRSAARIVIVERTATDAAFKLVTSGRDPVTSGRRDAAWRARADGVVEVVRGEWGRVELYEVHNDGIARLVATSRRSGRKVAGRVCEFAAGAALVAGLLGLVFVGERFALFFALMVALWMLSWVLKWTSDVRPWIRAQFGADGDWSQVQWQIEGTPTTGSQMLGLTALADDRDMRYRVVDDGTLEAVVRARKQIEVISIDRYGAATVTETLPSKRFKLDRLRGTDTTWHRITIIDRSE